MSVQWTRRDHRLDAELSVAFELGHKRLIGAKSPGQLDQAITYNLRLWRTARTLAGRLPDVVAREDVADTADLVATLLVVDAAPCPDPRDVDFVAGRDLAVARELIPDTAAQHVRDSLIAEWSASGRGRFDDWLLARVNKRAQ